MVKEVSKHTQEINPHAFESRLIEINIKNQVFNITKGCNCLKNHCDKNYCDCFKKGVSCSSLCRCTICKNSKIKIDPVLASQLSKRKNRKKKKIILSNFNQKLSK